MEEVYIKSSDLNKWIADEFPNKDLISIDDLIACIEDLILEREHLQEELDDLNKDLEDNYISKYKNKYDEYGVSEKDFH